MSDKYESDAEYTYQDEDIQDTDPVEFVHETQKDTTTQVIDFISNNSMVVSIGAAVVLYILYSLFSGLFTPSDIVEDIDSQFVQTTAVEVPVKAPQEEKKVEVVASAPVTRTASVGNEELSKIQASITKQSALQDKQSSTISNLSSAVVEIDSQIDNLNRSLLQINRSLEEITSKVNDALKPSVVTTPDEKPLVIYYLRASVWGRAFLTEKGNPNKTITVKVNDELEDYGSITGIYPSEGIVTTSSGRNIEFSPDES